MAGYPQIVMLGDSITQATTTTLQAWLQTRYMRRADILNRGFAGYTAPLGLSVLPKFIPTAWNETLPAVKVLFLFYGANDACCSMEEPTVPQVSLNQFSEALAEIITYPGLKAMKTKIVIITPPPVDEHRLPHDRLTAARAAMYASAARDIAKEYGLPLVDCWTTFLKYAGWDGDTHSLLPGDKRVAKNEALESLLSDGLHFTTKGYQVLFHELIAVVSRDIPEMAAENMPLTVTLAPEKPGWEWEVHGASDHSQVEGYPITQEEKDRAEVLKKEWEKILGVTVEEYFNAS